MSGSGVRIGTGRNIIIIVLIRIPVGLIPVPAGYCVEVPGSGGAMPGTAAVTAVTDILLTSEILISVSAVPLTGGKGMI